MTLDLGHVWLALVALGSVAAAAYTLGHAHGSGAQWRADRDQIEAARAAHPTSEPGRHADVIPLRRPPATSSPRGRAVQPFLSRPTPGSSVQAKRPPRSLDQDRRDGRRQEESIQMEASTTEDRAGEAAAALRRLADLIEERPALHEAVSGMTFRAFCITPEEFHDMARQLGGVREKDADDAYFKVVRDFGAGVKVQVYTQREQVCTAKVVGTETVEIPDPDAPKVTVTRDVVEWECATVIPAPDPVAEVSAALDTPDTSEAEVVEVAGGVL